MFEPYRHGAQFAVLFTIKNASGEPLTLIAADDPDSGHRLLQRVGVHFALVPEQSPEDAAHFAPGPGLSPPFGAVEPTPVTLPPGREAQIQFNFVMGDCQYFEPGQRETYNEQTTIHYRIGDNEKSSPIDLTGDQVTITAPAAADCPA